MSSYHRIRYPKFVSDMGNYIFHLCSLDEWEFRQKKDTYIPVRYELDGFIHCSFSDQIERIANTLFPRFDELMLLVIDADREEEFINKENLEGGEELFPHIYRELPKSSIVEVKHIYRSRDRFIIDHELIAIKKAG